MLFFYLITFLCGSSSLPLSSLSLAQKFIANNNSSLIVDKGSSNSSDLLTELKANPQKFIAEVQKLDPESIKHIIKLLKELRATSTTHENNLITDLSNKQGALDTSNQNLIDAENAEIAAAKAASDADAAHVAAINAHNDAKTDDSAKQTAKDLAEEAAKEIPSLDDEQQILTDVINMMTGLHEKYAGFKVGTCQPSGTYTKNDCCADGYVEVESISECQRAVQEFPDMGVVGYGGTTHWNDRPSGCFWHQPNKYFYFNTDPPSGRMAGDDKVICALVG